MEKETVLYKILTLNGVQDGMLEIIQKYTKNSLGLDTDKAKKEIMEFLNKSIRGIKFKKLKLTNDVLDLLTQEHNKMAFNNFIWILFKEIGLIKDIKINTIFGDGTICILISPIGYQELK